MSLLTSLLPSFVSPSSCAVGTAASNVNNDSLPTRRPVYQVNETADGYSVTVQLPGVTKDHLDVTAEDGVLTVTGKRAWQKPEGWTSLHRESGDFDYALSLAYEDAIDADKISAALSDGVLRLTLPKSEARKPRKVTVA